MLKGGGAIIEAEGQNTVLIGAVARAEGGEIFNIFLEVNIVKGMVDIQLSKDAGFGQACECLINQWYQVLVLLHDGVQLAVINAESPSTSRLLGKQDG